MRRVAQPHRIVCQHRGRSKPQRLLIDEGNWLHQGSASNVLQGGHLPPPPSERRGRQHCRRCGRASTPAAPAKVHPPEPGESVAAGGKSHIVGGKLERARGDSPHKTARRIRVSLRAVLEGCARQADPLLFWARANELCFAHPPLGRTERDSSDETAHRSRVSNIVKVWRVVLATRLCRHG